jgi:phage shock protein PspC (stress-responsive transcriptional regulator)
MKKTLTVNLNNIVFHIDDDAYEMLQTYLHEIADHFQSDDEKNEIMNDIEARIAELFNEKLQKNKNVVNLTDVEEIIEIMGKPSQYADEDEEPKSPKTNKKQQQQKSRRFYRDPENAILGGIAGGLAAYLNIDVTWIRIFLVLLVFLGVGFIIPIYIVVWFVAPAALTASQRLEMQGEDVTVESIKTEINNVKNYMESESFKQSATTVGEKIQDALKWFFKIVFGFIGAVLGLVGVVLVGALILLLFFLIFEPTVINGFAPDIITNWAVLSPEKMVMLIISLILVIGCPIFLLIYWAVRLVSGRHETPRTASWVVLILWIAGMFMFYSVGANTLIRFHHLDGHPYAIAWNDDNKPFEDEVRKCDPFKAIEVSGNIELTVKQDSVQEVRVSFSKEYLSKIKTNVENGVLHIYSDEIFLFQNKSIKVYVSSDSIKSLIAKGACKIEGGSKLVSPDFSLELLGASQANLDVNVKGLFKVDVKGASKVDVKGNCSIIKANGVGASEINATELKASQAEVYVAGASHANVFASESINAEAYGASEIDCKGTPKTVKKSDGGASSIHIE